MTAQSKWQVCFYREGQTLPFDAHNFTTWREARERAVSLSRDVTRQGMRCEIVNRKPSAVERDEYEKGKSALRWRLRETPTAWEFDAVKGGA